MSQHDYIIDNASTLNVRLDFNDALDALVSNSEGPSEPPAPVGDPPDALPRSGMFWFNSSIAPDGRMKRRLADDSDWEELSTADELVSKTGPVVIEGDLHVAGNFVAPNFNRLRASYEGKTEPTDPVAGMLWYDTNPTPGVLRVRDKDNAAWTIPAQLVAPVFTVSMTINNPTGLAELNLLSQPASGPAERRRLLSDAAGNRMSFYGPNDGLMGYITDQGDFVSALDGSLLAALNGKQANLGFTPVRQAAGAPNIGLYWAGTPAGLHFQINQAYAGQIVTSTSYVPPPFAWTRGYTVGSLSWLYRSSNTMWPGDSTLAASAVDYGWDDSHGSESPPAGTWRNLGGDAEYVGFPSNSGACTVAQRIF